MIFNFRKFSQSQPNSLIWGFAIVRDKSQLWERIFYSLKKTPHQNEAIGHRILNSKAMGNP
ncbi:hypothetical protein P872_22755 [Rhodonellum psychrophilum GCM71 = DSM 17998]|uniref:Uncharacterized protein n=1 Tax=Rhodonellum psychrophilum GCM71 = DSM 17998 TaxID=1123057 RepID=U5C520_9BACT|nr:hypothetical protein P872_22755 [Rhodonellum psychrophilum GCM71 = DSM 17998]